MSATMQTDVDETVEDVTTSADAGSDERQPLSTPNDADQQPDPDTPSDAAADPAGEANPEQQADGDLAQSANTVPAVEEPKPTPFMAKVLGQQYEAKALGMEGAQVRPDGTVEIPPGRASERLSALLAKGRMYEERVPQQLHEAREQVRQVQATFNEDAERGRAIYEFFSQLATKSEQEIYDFVLDFKTQKPLLDTKVAVALEQQRLQAMRQAANPPAAYNLSPEHLEVQAQEAAWERSLAVMGKVKGLTRDEAFEVAKKLWNNKMLYLGVADRDYPEFNVVRGQPVFNTAKWEEDFQDRAADIVRGRQAVAKAAKVVPKVQSAANGNAAVLAQANGKATGKAPPPPPAGAASTKAAVGNETAEQYKARVAKELGYVPNWL